MSMIWVPHAVEAWQPVVVVSNDATSISVRDRNGGSEYKIPGNIASFDTVTPSALEEDCENLVNLEAYNEGIILHHIKKRFATDKIYTLVGNILIALNPYKAINIYDMPVVEKIFQNVKNKDEPLPHVYTIAAMAINNMRQDKKDQSVLISGKRKH
jgi:myosin heavy subunit